MHIRPCKLLHQLYVTGSYEVITYVRTSCYLIWTCNIAIIHRYTAICNYIAWLSHDMWESHFIYVIDWCGARCFQFGCKIFFAIGICIQMLATTIHAFPFYISLYVLQTWLLFVLHWKLNGWEGDTTIITQQWCNYHELCNYHFPFDWRQIS